MAKEKIVIKTDSKAAELIKVTSSTHPVKVEKVR